MQRSTNLDALVVVGQSPPAPPAYQEKQESQDDEDSLDLQGPWQRFNLIVQCMSHFNLLCNYHTVFILK